MTEIAVDRTAPVNGGPSPGTSSAAATVASELTDAFLLGATISELQGRIRVAALDPSLGASPLVDAPSTSTRESFAPYVDADSNIAWTTSAWRVLFDRLALLHARFFANSTTRNTHYDPGERMPPFFFPSDEPDYAQIGIAAQPPGKELLPAFSLYDATRRGLNCLTLLCIHPDVSLLPQVIKQQQARLLALMPDRANNPEAGTDAAISITVQQVLQFLHAWEGYLRESFYTAGMSARNENNLIAFEAGLSMAWLSWGISVHALSHPPEETDEAKQQRLRDLWEQSFGAPDISRLQHQVSILGKAIDDAASAGGESVAAQTTAQAVKRSLDYWQRAVKWLLRQTDPTQSGDVRRIGPLSDDDWDRLRVALIAQSSIWQALMLGQQPLAAYSAEGVSQRIMQDVAVRFQQLAASRGLFGAAEQVGQTVLKEVELAADQVRAIATTAQAAISAQLQQTLGTLVRSFWPVIVVLVAITALGLFVLLQRAAVGQTSTWVADLSTPLVGVASTVGLLFARNKLASQRPVTVPVPPTPEVVTAPAPVEEQGVVGRLGGFAGQIGGEILNSFERGFTRVQEDLAVLGRSVAVTYPLVEYFVLNQAWKDFGADVDFMDKVVWDETDRHEEIVRVASAAFGAIGVFAIASGSTDTTPASKRGD